MPKVSRFTVEIPPHYYKAMMAMGNGLPHSLIIKQMIEICVPRAIAAPLHVPKPDMAKYIDINRVGRFGRITGKRMLDSGEIKMAKTPALKKILEE